MKEVADPAGFLGFLIGLALSLVMVITVTVIDEIRWTRAAKKELIRGEK